MTDRHIDSLNKAYLLGEYDLKRYRELRVQLIDEFTHSKPPVVTTGEDKDRVTDPTLKITQPKPAPDLSGVSAEKNHRGPSFLQFLWVSIAVLLFIYMYTASI
ncbi:MAG: hypothetical protein ACC707_04450 [Thiohalomonadales bacterium]